MRSWCTSCHHRDLDGRGRQGAPADVALLTDADFQTGAERVGVCGWADCAAMPLAGGPTKDELVALAEWMDCGAPE